MTVQSQLIFRKHYFSQNTDLPNVFSNFWKNAIQLMQEILEILKRNQNCRQSSVSQPEENLRKKKKINIK